jgi:dienelactone hydrolase
MKTQTLEYSYGKNKFVGYLAWDDTATDLRPGIVVFPEAFGLNDHARVRAERLAQSGFVALAADLHGDGVVYDDFPSLTPSIQALFTDRPNWRAQAQAALDALAGLAQVDAQRLAAIGFCFGGATCFELARSGASLAAIATFHAGLLPELPTDAGNIRAKVLICNGAEDPVVKQAALDAVIGELKRDKVDWQCISYGNTVHSFTDPGADKRNLPGFAYSPIVEKRSWSAMLDLLAEVFPR